MTDDAKASGTTPPLDVGALQEQIDALTKELNDAKTALAESEAANVDLERFRDLAARAQADLQNAKARMEREREEIGTFASERLIRKLLPTVDNFQRAFKHLPEELKSHEWVKGIVAMEQELMRQMTDVGLRRMEALGTPIDPERHEVLMADEGGADYVAEVFEDGYELGGKILRVAKVKAGPKA